MKKSLFLISAGLVLAAATVCYAQQRVYSFKCIRCGAVLQFTQNKARVVCPADGTVMNPTR